jgi:hypothetical protein
MRAGRLGGLSFSGRIAGREGALRWQSSGPPFVSQLIGSPYVGQYLTVRRTRGEHRETALIWKESYRTLNQRVAGSSPATPTNPNVLITKLKVDNQNTDHH